MTPSRMIKTIQGVGIMAQAGRRIWNAFSHGPGIAAVIRMLNFPGNPRAEEL